MLKKTNASSVGKPTYSNQLNEASSSSSSDSEKDASISSRLSSIEAKNFPSSSKLRQKQRATVSENNSPVLSPINYPSISSIGDDDIPILTMQDYESSIERFKEFHFSTIENLSIVKSMQGELTKLRTTANSLLLELEQARLNIETTRSDRDAVLTATQLKQEQAEKSETFRKTHAVNKAKQRDSEITFLEEKIISFKEQLEYTREKNEMLEEYSKKAEKYIQFSQDSMSGMKNQLNYLNEKLEKKSTSLDKKIHAQEKLIQKNKEILQEKSDFSNAMDLTNRQLMDTALRQKELAGLTMIQRDLARARLTQGTSNFASSSSAEPEILGTESSIIEKEKRLIEAFKDTKINAFTSYENKTIIANAKEMKNLTKTTKKMMQETKSISAITPEAKIAVLESHNLALTATNQVLSKEIEDQKKTNTQLHEINNLILKKSKQSKEALEKICDQVGLDFKKIIKS